MEIDRIKELIELMASGQIVELEFESGQMRVRLKREPSFVGRAQEVPVASKNESESEPEAAAVAEDEYGEQPEPGVAIIRSPIVGTFYRCPAPGADPFVEVGDYVVKKQVLCIVEAMKVMNEIESDFDGRVVKILVEDAHPVEYGQPLMWIEPAS